MLSSHAMLIAAIQSSLGGAGAPSETVSLSGGTVAHLVFDPSNATASLSFQTNGNVSNTGTDLADWLDPLRSGAGSDYEIWVGTVTGDNWSGPTKNTWHSLSSARTWTLSQTVVGSASGTATIKIRDAATQTEQASASYTLTATVDEGGPP